MKAQLMEATTMRVGARVRIRDDRWTVSAPFRGRVGVIDMIGRTATERGTYRRVDLGAPFDPLWFWCDELELLQEGAS